MVNGTREKDVGMDDDKVAHAAALSLHARKTANCCTNCRRTAAGYGGYAVGDPA